MKATSKKRLRPVLWIGIAVLCGAAYGLASGIPLTHLRAAIERELGEIVGLPVHIEGSTRLALIPWARLEVAALRVENLPGRSTPSLLTIEELGLELRILPLLRGHYQIESFEVQGAALHIEPDAEGAWPLRVDIEATQPEPQPAEEEELQLSLRELVVDDLRIVFDPSGAGQTRSLHVRELVAGAPDRQQPLVLEVDGSFEGEAFRVEATLGSLAELLTPARPFPVDLAASLAVGTLEAQGTLGGPGLELRFDAQLENLSKRAREFGFELPPLGAWAVAGVLTRRDGSLGLEQLSIRSRGEGPLDLVVEGSIRDLPGLEGLDLALRLAAPDLQVFESLSPVSLPRAPIRAVLQLDDADGSLGIDGEVEASRRGTLAFTAQGVFDDLRRANELDVRLGLEALDLQKLGALFDRENLELPELGPLQASGRLVFEEGTLELTEIDARLGDPEAIWARARGRVKDLLGLRGVELEAHLGAASARKVAALFEREIPEVGALTAAFSLTDRDGSLGIERATLAVGQPGVFELKVSGAFDDLRDLEEVHVDVELSARDLGAFAALADTQLPAIGPVAFRGEAHGSADAVRASGRLQLADNRFEGEVSGSLRPGTRPVLGVRVQSPHVHLPDFVTPTEDPALRRARAADRGFDPAAWWSGEQPLPLAALPEIDARVDLEVARVTGYELLNLEDLVVSAHLVEGRLVVDEFAAEYESGRVAGRFELDTRPAIPSGQLQFESFNVDLTQLLSQFRTEVGYDGSLDLSIDLRTSGTSAQELRSNLGGFIGAMLRDGALLGESARVFTVDFLRVSIPNFLPGPGTSGAVQCLLAVMPIENGVVDVETLYLAGAEITILGTGRIDLADEHIDLRLTPHPHDPALVSVAVSVQVEGPLGRPVIRPVRTSLVVSAFQALWRNAMRPVRSAERVLRRLARRPTEEREDPCGQVAQQRVRQMQTDVVEPIDLKVLLDGVSSPRETPSSALQ